MRPCAPLDVTSHTGALTADEVRELGADAAAFIREVADRLEPARARAFWQFLDARNAAAAARYEAAMAAPDRAEELGQLADRRSAEAAQARADFERAVRETAERASQEVEARFPEAKATFARLRGELEADRLDVGRARASADYAKAGHWPLAYTFGARCAVQHWEQALAPRQAEHEATRTAYTRLRSAYERLGQLTFRFPRGDDPQAK